MNNRDLFEDLKEHVRCDYISDLKYDPWLKRARILIAKMELSRYSLLELSSAAEYLYSEKLTFNNSNTAQEYFKSRLQGSCQE